MAGVPVRFTARRAPERPAALCAAIAAGLVACACATVPTPAPTLPGGIRIAGPDGRRVTPDPALLTAVAKMPTADPSDPGTFAERGEFPLPASTRPVGFETYSWQHLLDDAAGTTVRFALRDADPPRSWIDDWVVDVAAGRYGITVTAQYAPAAADVVARLTAEKAAGTAEGTIDLMWIDDASYGALASGGLLYGPWTSYTPSRRYLDPADTWLQRSFGLDVNGDALAWGRAHFVFLHDPARAPSPPASWLQLWTWIEANPGRFAYAAPPDPTGSAFVRQACIALAADAAAFAAPPDDASAEAVLAPCWAKLNAIEPRLWAAGARYPATQAEVDALFEAGETDLNVRYGPPPVRAAGAAPGGASAARAFTLDGGLLSRTHFLAIPFNAPNKQGAIVLANFLQDPEAQFAKLTPENWGDPSVIAPHRIPDTWRLSYDQIQPSPDTLAEADVVARRLAEPHARWLAAIDGGWAARVGASSTPSGVRP